MMTNNTEMRRRASSNYIYFFFADIIIGVLALVFGWFHKNNWWVFHKLVSCRVAKSNAINIKHCNFVCFFLCVCVSCFSLFQLHTKHSNTLFSFYLCLSPWGTVQHPSPEYLARSNWGYFLFIYVNKTYQTKQYEQSIQMWFTWSIPM